jgi:hypothetical protein
MQLVLFRHKGLRQLHEDSNAKGVASAKADKLRKLCSPSKPPRHWSSSAGFQAGSRIHLKAI